MFDLEKRWEGHDTLVVILDVETVAGRNLFLSAWDGAVVRAWAARVSTLFPFIKGDVLSPLKTLGDQVFSGASDSQGFSYSNWIFSNSSFSVGSGSVDWGKGPSMRFVVSPIVEDEDFSYSIERLLESSLSKFFGARPLGSVRQNVKTDDGSDMFAAEREFPDLLGRLNAEIEKNALSGGENHCSPKRGSSI